jgi:hypothetical protein
MTKMYEIIGGGLNYPARAHCAYITCCPKKQKEHAGLLPVLETSRQILHWVNDPLAGTDRDIVTNLGQRDIVTGDVL